MLPWYHSTTTTLDSALFGAQCTAPIILRISSTSHVISSDTLHQTPDCDTLPDLAFNHSGPGDSIAVTLLTTYLPCSFRHTQPWTTWSHHVPHMTPLLFPLCSLFRGTRSCSPTKYHCFFSAENLGLVIGLYRFYADTSLGAPALQDFTWRRSSDGVTARSYVDRGGLGSLASCARADMGWLAGVVLSAASEEPGVGPLALVVYAR